MTDQPVNLHVGAERPSVPEVIMRAPLVDPDECGTEATHVKAAELNAGERAITVAPGVWTVAHVDNDRMVVVQVFHTNTAPITLGVDLAGNGRHIGPESHYPPAGWRVREVPFEDTGVPSLVARAATVLQQHADAQDDGQHMAGSAFQAIEAPAQFLETHPLEHGTDR